MKVNNSKSIRFAIAAALAVGTCQIASAVGLGPISVNSHIGEPLQASIKVNGLSPSDAANTRINIADAAAYQRRGITKLPSHDGLRFGLTRAGNGYIITVRSNQQIREPFINFLLTMNSGGEEIVREYAVFLEPAAGGAIPPVMTEVVESPAVPVDSGPKLLEITPASSTSVGWQGNGPKVTQVQPVSSSPTTTVTRSAPPVTKSAPPPIPKGPQAPWTGQTYGPVQPGETLYSIANTVRPEGYSIQSVMRQIYHANRGAFSSRSLSSLMAGYTLKIPDFQHGSVAAPAPAKPKRKASYKPAVAPKAKAAEVAAQADEAAQQQQVDGTDTAGQETDTTVQQPQVATAEAVVGEESVQPSLLNDGETEAVVEEESSSDDATTTPVADGDEAVESGDGEIAIEGSVQPSTDEVVEGEEVVTGEEIEPETTVVEDAVESIMPPVDEQPVLIEENVEDNSQDAVVTPEPVQAAVPANAPPVAPPPVAEEEDKGFLFTTYAILPMWQWLVIAVVALALIALLLFRLRRKSVVDDNGIDDGDGLDADEMEAVLAKINAMDDDDDTAYGDAAYTPAQHHDNAEDDWDVESFVDNVDDDAVTQEVLSEPARHNRADVSLNKETHQAADLSDDSADFLFDDEQPTDKQQAASQAVEEDFFADDDMDWNELGAPEVPEKPAEAAPTQPAAAAPAEPTPAEPAPAAKPSSSSSDMDWLDDLVFDGEERPTRKAKPASAAPSSDEMEINLDLASSFIATGHGERAVSWLEEVMELGNAEQKARAQELLDKIRGD